MKNFSQFVLTFLYLASFSALAAELKATKTEPAKTPAAPALYKAFFAYETVPLVAGVLKTKEGVTFYTNAKLSLPVSLPKTGSYDLSFDGSGTLATKAGPQVELGLDGKVFKTFDVTAAKKTYVVNTTLTEGKHFVTISFINDVRDNKTGEDRNFTMHSATVQATTAP